MRILNVIANLIKLLQITLKIARDQCYRTNLIITKQLTRHTVKPKAIILKYFSINDFMGGPYFHSKSASRKNLAPLLIIDESRNMNRLISNTPDVTVKIL
jgi:hypothetical protein